MIFYYTDKRFHTSIPNHVVCSTDWEMRLVNGGSSLEGRLEVCLNGVWGTICDQSWDDTDAGVVCSQMGYSARGKMLYLGERQIDA